jgi:hypothetical protein
MIAQLEAPLEIGTDALKKGGNTKKVYVSL